MWSPGSARSVCTVIDVALERFRHDQDQYAQLLDARRQANRERVIAQARRCCVDKGSVNPTPMRNCAVRQCVIAAPFPKLPSACLLVHERMLRRKIGAHAHAGGNTGQLRRWHDSRLTGL